MKLFKMTTSKDMLEFTFDFELTLISKVEL